MVVEESLQIVDVLHDPDILKYIYNHQIVKILQNLPLNSQQYGQLGNAQLPTVILLCIVNKSVSSPSIINLCTWYIQVILFEIVYDKRGLILFSPNL